MSDSEKLKNLLDAFVELNRLSASPGEASHKLWHSTEFIQRQIKELLKKDDAKPDLEPALRALVADVFKWASRPQKDGAKNLRNSAALIEESFLRGSGK